MHTNNLSTKTFNYTCPEGIGYWDYINQHFRHFIKVVGGGSRVVRCHPSVAPLFDFIGIIPKIDEDLRHGEARVAGSQIFVENLE